MFMLITLTMPFLIILVAVILCFSFLDVKKFESFLNIYVLLFVIRVVFRGFIYWTVQLVEFY